MRPTGPADGASECMGHRGAKEFFEPPFVKDSGCGSAGAAG